MYLNESVRAQWRRRLDRANPGGQHSIARREPTTAERSVFERLRDAEIGCSDASDRTLAVYLGVDPGLTPVSAARFERRGQLSTVTLLADFALTREVGDVDGALALCRVLQARDALPELSTDRIRAAVTVLNDLPSLVGTRAQLDAARADAERELCAAIAEHAGLDPEGLSVGGWPCPWSPVTCCVYASDDPWCDDCVYCHEPSERK